MRVPEEPVCIDLFRQNPVFTSLHLKYPAHVVPPPKCCGSKRVRYHLSQPWGVNILEDERNRIALLQWSLYEANHPSNKRETPNNRKPHPNHMQRPISGVQCTKTALSERTTVVLRETTYTLCSTLCTAVQVKVFFNTTPLFPSPWPVANWQKIRLHWS
jgi:hypothetical protein